MSTHAVPVAHTVHNIMQSIHLAAVKHEMFGRKPLCLYLGRKQDALFKAAIDTFSDFRWRVRDEITTVRRREFEGMKIYVVDAADHLAVGIESSEL